MSRRDAITMSPEEVAGFLVEQRVVICATNGHRGWPHLMPLWYVLRDARDDGPSPRLWAWTYGKSQKVRNLERDPRATLQIEDGESYDQLRGLMIEAETVIHRDTELVLDFGLELFARYSGDGQSPEFKDAIRAQATKRVALQFKAERIASFDHRKLAGAY